MLNRFSILSESERVTRVWGASVCGRGGQRSGERRADRGASRAEGRGSRAAPFALHGTR